MKTVRCGYIRVLPFKTSRSLQVSYSISDVFEIEQFKKRNIFIYIYMCIYFIIVVAITLDYFRECQLKTNV